MIHDAYNGLLYIGDAISARDLKQIYDHEFAAVLDLAANEPPAVLGRDIIYCRFPLSDDDSNDDDIVSAAIECLCFFDEIDRTWLVKFLEHRIGDRRIIRLIQKWLNAGVIEDTDWSDDGKGTSQGSVISPLLANVYLHYVFDLWINQWRKRHCQGNCIVVRYADDFVIGFESESEARQCLDALQERLAKFGLQLHPDKTRLIEFGRTASARSEREGRGRCETFEFLGFTHVCGKTRKNKRFVLWRRTSRKRFTRTLQAIKAKLRKRRHDPVGTTGRWLASVIRGWLGYHAVPDNFSRLDEFVTEVTKLWLHQLRRRSQKGRAAWPWERMNRLVDRYLPQPKILHPYPKDRFRARLAAGAV